MQGSLRATGERARAGSRAGTPGLPKAGVGAAPFWLAGWLAGYLCGGRVLQQLHRRLLRQGRVGRRLGRVALDHRGQVGGESRRRRWLQPASPAPGPPGTLGARASSRGAGRGWGGRVASDRPAGERGAGCGALAPAGPLAARREGAGEAECKGGGASVAGESDEATAAAPQKLPAAARASPWHAPRKVGRAAKAGPVRPRVRPDPGYASLARRKGGQGPLYLQSQVDRVQIRVLGVSSRACVCLDLATLSGAPRPSSHFFSHPSMAQMRFGHNEPLP